MIIFNTKDFWKCNKHFNWFCSLIYILGLLIYVSKSIKPELC